MKCPVEFENTCKCWNKYDIGIPIPRVCPKVYQRKKSDFMRCEWERRQEDTPGFWTSEFLLILLFTILKNHVVHILDINHISHLEGDNFKKIPKNEVTGQLLFSKERLFA